MRGDTDDCLGSIPLMFFPYQDGCLPVTKTYRCQPITYIPYNIGCKNVRSVVA